MNSHVALERAVTPPSTGFRLPAAARRGARIAGAAEGLALGVAPLVIGARYLADDEYSEAGLAAIGILSAGAVVAAWVLPYLVARGFRVGRAGAVIWVSLAITTAAMVVTGAIAAAAAIGAVLVGVIVTWSGLLYQPSIVVAVIVTILLPTLLGMIVTPALARALNAKRIEGAADSAAAPALDTPAGELPAIRI